MKFLYIGAMLAAAGSFLAGSPPADAAGNIFTGGEKGAYFSLFCPPLPGALQSKYFPGYKCVPSNGTVDNIGKVLASPTDIGFAQLDVFAEKAKADPTLTQKLTIIRELACEGLWLVTKNAGLTNYGDVLGYARRIPFVLPPETSGAAATFHSLMVMDPDGLGRSRNISYAESATAMLERVAASAEGEVGFFVQFADPSNANIQFVVEKKLTVLPLVSRDMISLQVDGVNVYKVQEFTLEDEWLDTTATTACTPAVIFTGNPASMTDPLDQADQQEMIEAIRSVPDKDLRPQVGAIAALMAKIKSLSGDALDKLIAGIEDAEKAIKEKM